MGETDPAQILPAKKQVTETNVSGPVGMPPIIPPPMGMPMSHQPAVPGEPEVPAHTDDVPVLMADTEVLPFGSHMVMPVHEVVPTTVAETVVPRTFERLEPVIPAEPATPLEPRILPAGVEPVERGIEPLERPACQCCGDTHDGQEDRHFERVEDRAHDGEPRLDDDGVPAGEAVPDVEPRRLERLDPGPEDKGPDSESDSCCCCCGDHHDFEPAPDDKGTVPDTPVTDPDSEDDDRCGPDGEEQHHDDKHDDKHDRDDDKHDRHDDKHDRQDDKHDGRGDKHDPDSRGDRTPRDETPPDERPWKAVTDRPVSERPVSERLPTEPESAYAVRQRMPDAEKHTPGETMAPPLQSRRLGTPAGSEAVPAQPRQVAMRATQAPEATTPTQPRQLNMLATRPADPAKTTVPGGQPVPGQVPPSTPEGTEDADPPKATPTQAFRALAPTAPADPGKTPLMPRQQLVTTSKPEQTGPGNQQVPPPVTGGGTTPYTTSTYTTPNTTPFTPGGTNSPPTAPPTDGNVGPDPNVKFDEGQYNQLINVIADVEAGVFNSVIMGDVYLGSVLKLQPSGQKWPPAVDLVKWGSDFGGSVDTQTTSLGDSLSSFHDALEEAKAVFKNTDDLAAYDATKFTSEYPGFNGGLAGA